MIIKSAVIPVARQEAILQSRDDRHIVFTSYMDHAIGQMWAAYRSRCCAGHISSEAGLLTHERFAAGVLVVAIGFIATLNLINPDALIVRHNLQRYQVTGDLDIPYLTTLSHDAVPLLITTYHEIEGDNQPITLPYCYEDDCQTTMPKMLKDNLLIRYKSLREVQWQTTLLSYHHTRHQAYQSLICFHSTQTTAAPYGSILSHCTVPR